MDFNAKNIPFSLHPLGLIEAFISQGADIDDLLKNTGLNRQLIYSKGIKISFIQQCRIVENGLRACTTPGLGFVIGNSIDWNFYGSLGGIINCSPSLADACAIFRRYLQIAQPIYRLFFSEPEYFLDKGNYLITPIRTILDDSLSPELAKFELEYRLAILLRIYDACGNKSAKDNSIRIGLVYNTVNYADALKSMPRIDVRFNCRFSYIAVHRNFFYTRWRELRTPLFEKIIEQCEIEFANANLESSYAEKVQWLISNNFKPEVRLQDIAEKMHTTPRALTRKLAKENASFRTIFNRVRMSLACLYLRDSHLSVSEIADIMGFSCPASLRRAVKSWRAIEAAQSQEKHAQENGEEYAY
ncbi:MAG: AraC family transcriptional regulator [Gammaproteobacteria bacterium]|nr:MAG: AraC family transcriptional regulator [Gammaproteobacteria bacterium]